MLPKILLIIATATCVVTAQAQQIAFERDDNRNTTATYEEVTAFYRTIADTYAQAELLDIGQTDVGKPLHLLVLSADGDFDPKSIKSKNKAVLLVNNGIHPGEPEGIDVSMMFVRDILKNTNLPEDVVICIIPVYNIAGMLNRGTSRANQNGPEAYGFRGSSQHYDLNRDFIKTDTRNAKLFQQVFNTWDPDILFDTHASNGADYQYTMTLIATQKDKLAAPVSAFMQDALVPTLYERMAESGFPMIPYVQTKGTTPESGLVDFLETPRYSSGYAALHHTIGFMPETHMWKPYEARVNSTYELLRHLLQTIVETKDELIHRRHLAKEHARRQTSFPITWYLDTTRVDTIDFLGYEALYKKSEVTGHDRLYYDRNKPKHMRVPYYHHYTDGLHITKPQAYIIPQAYEKVVELLQINGVNLTPLPQDTVLEAEMYYITSYETGRTPYEGHYMHHSVEVSPLTVERHFYKGDWLVQMDQIANRYIIETLEPQAPDSFFNWNFFDAILSRKEYFSPYIFEEEALRLLQEHPEWRSELEKEKQNNPSLANDPRRQLDWIYQRSPYYEDTHLLYPIARILPSL